MLLGDPLFKPETFELVMSLPVLVHTPLRAIRNNIGRETVSALDSEGLIRCLALGVETTLLFRLFH